MIQVPSPLAPPDRPDPEPALLDAGRVDGGLGYDVVIPTVGRASLRALLEALDLDDPGLAEVVVVDDRRDRRDRLPLPPATGATTPVAREVVRVVAGPAAGPAAARNRGLRVGSSPWVVFLDDDTLPDDGWSEALRRDLAAAGPLVAAVQAQLEVPLPTDRRPTDRERSVAGLASSRWITADLAVRRVALEHVGGFDERFPRAYREDADLALRLVDAGWRLARGARTTRHPVQPAGFWSSVRSQAGNADDVTMLLRHGWGWRRRAGAPRGTRSSHAIGVVAAVVAAVGWTTRRRRLATVAASVWAAATGRFAWHRIEPGPRDPIEVLTMVATSVVLPFAAIGWWLRGWVAAARRSWAERSSRAPRRLPDAVLVDRDGTLVVDVPYNGDPDLVRLLPGVRVGLDRLRSLGIPVAMVTNQSGVARGLLTDDAVDAVNERVRREVGGLDHVEVCRHGPNDGCGCRKPAPGSVLRAAAALGADPRRCVVIGDIGADVEAAAAAGARGILVPTARTRVDEVRGAPEVAGDFDDAVRRVVGRRRGGRG